jgi:alpha-amylase
MTRSHSTLATQASAANIRLVVVALMCVTGGLAGRVASQARPANLSDWRDGAVCYEVFVRSFYDSDGDGVGDINGLIQKLDYINDGDSTSGADLGARCIWLMPVNPATSYHGYDVTDYYRVDPRYGTNADFRRLIDQAHLRGIRVLVDLVVNHTSNEHPFFKHAQLYLDSPYRDWYRWRETPGPNNEWGSNNWHRSASRDEYYYGFFWRTMPDLNWETAAVREEMVRVAAFWLGEMGVDGFRLDAVRHLMEDEQGRATNVPRTHDMLREFAAQVREIDPRAFTLGEVFDSTAELLAYYPDQLDAYFAFEVSEAILQAVRSGSSSGLMDAVLQLQQAVPNDRWAPFLRNHDQTRAMTWLNENAELAKLAASLLLTLPGLPFVYYGEEIGMTGDKPDPRIRTPMHWNLEAAAGFSEGIPWEPLQPDSFSANVAAQAGEPGSLLSHYRRLIHLRAEHPALGAGMLVPLHTETEQIAAFLRRNGDHVALIIANLGSTTLSRVALSSAAGALPPGRYSLTALLAAREAAPLEIGADGRMRNYVPVSFLAPQETHVFEISSGGTRSP